MGLRKISAKEDQFARCVAHGRLSFAEAYRTAFTVENSTSPLNAGRRGWNIARDPAVAARIEELYAETRQKYEACRDELIRFWRARRSYNAANIVRLLKGCCRYCHGDGFSYQWTERQYLEDCATAERDKTPLPNYGGGWGFNPTNPPHPDCPECGGKGLQHVDITDTTELSATDLAGLTSISVTAQGIKIELADKAEAAREEAKLFGMTTENIKIGLFDVPDEETLRTYSLDEATQAYRKLTATTH